MSAVPGVRHRRRRRGRPSTSCSRAVKAALDGLSGADHQHHRRHRHRRPQRRRPAAARDRSSTCRRTSPTVPTACSTSSTGTTTASAASRTASSRPSPAPAISATRRGDDPKTIDFNHPTNVCFDHDGNMIVAAWHNSLVKKIDVLPDGSAGLVTNLAGTGARAFGGDGGPGNAGQARPAQLGGGRHQRQHHHLRPGQLPPAPCSSRAAPSTPSPAPARRAAPATAARRSQAQLNGPKGQSAAPASRIAIDARNRIYIADTGNHKIRLIDEVGDDPHHRRHRHAGLQRRRRPGDARRSSTRRATSPSRRTARSTSPTR